MAYALRVSVMLAVALPIFAATAFRLTWWQTLLAAIVGSALGQLAVRLTHGHRRAQWLVAAAATVVAVVGGCWPFLAPTRRTANDLLILRGSLTADDVRVIETQVSPIARVVPRLAKQLPLTSADLNWRTRVVGTTPDYFDLMGLRLAAGARFDAAATDKVVVLGDTVVAHLFGTGKQPIGEAVRINNTPFTIIGVLAHHGEASNSDDLDDVAIIPIDIYTSKISPAFDGAVLLAAKPGSDLARIEAVVHTLLRDRHQFPAGADDDFVFVAGRSAQ